MVCRRSRTGIGIRMGMALNRIETIRLTCRSLFLQAMLNYRTMQGPGYLYALWPWLRNAKRSSQEIRASADYLNAHPVLATLAIGALRRRIENGDVQKNPDEFSKWQTELCGPLGTIGDQLIWDRWKPLIFGLGVLILMWKPSLGPWLGVAVGSLLLYNVPLIWLRYWGIREGYRLGERVLESLDRPRTLIALRRSLGVAGATVAGGLLASGFLRAGLMHDQKFSLFHPIQFLRAFGVTLAGFRRRWPILWTLFLGLGTATLLPLFMGSLSY